MVNSVKKRTHRHMLWCHERPIPKPKTNLNSYEYSKFPREAFRGAYFGQDICLKKLIANDESDILELVQTHL